MSNTNKLISRTIAVLWIIWAFFHVIPGLISIMAAINGDISFIQNLEPQTNPQQLTSDYPTEVFAILVIYAQHSYNLFWFGLVTLVCAIIIWRQPNRTAMLLAAVVGGLADLGVIFFIDLFGGYGSLFGTAITVVAFAAIGLSIYLVFGGNRQF
ncbi:MAG: hypothetical protein AAF633_15315 [Chloroflexota bacterium]